MPPGWAASRFNAFVLLTQPIQFSRLMPTTRTTGTSRRRTTTKSTAVSAAGLTVMFVAVAVIFCTFLPGSFIYDGAILVPSAGRVKAKIVAAGTGFCYIFVDPAQIQPRSALRSPALVNKSAGILLPAPNCFYSDVSEPSPDPSTGSGSVTTFPWLSNSMSMTVPSPLGR